MARQIGFHVYSVRVREKFRRSHETLSRIQGDKDLLSVLHAGMKQILEQQKKEADVERVAYLKKCSVADDRHLVGILEAGHYGEDIDIMDVNSGQLAHRQTQNEASVVPCFFRLIVPKGETTGLLILQRENRVQSKGAFLSLVQPVIADMNADLNLEIMPVMNSETFQTLVGDGKVQQVRFIRHSVPPDFADLYGTGKNLAEETGSVELVFKAARGRTLPLGSRFLNWMMSTRDGGNSDLFELKNFPTDSIKADLRIGRRRRTVDFGKRLTSPIIDLTDQITLRRGRPTWDSLLEATASLAEDQLADLRREDER
jgi:hypothetical protein